VLKPMAGRVRRSQDGFRRTASSSWTDGTSFFTTNTTGIGASSKANGGLTGLLLAHMVVVNQGNWITVEMVLEALFTMSLLL